MKSFQAKHIEDRNLLRIIRLLHKAERARHPYGDVSRWDIIELLRPVPWKVVQAKLTALERRGLIDGCASGCTCRGGFSVTEKGEALLASKEAAE